MAKARLLADRDFVLSDLDRRIFGTFVEHPGRCVYGGFYEPGHPSADEHGFRGDALELTRELGPTIVRYPGGNFMSGHVAALALPLVILLQQDACQRRSRAVRPRPSFSLIRMAATLVATRRPDCGCRAAAVPRECH